eukprot:TRINITY_DN976_c0_g1::TRINITY_DN976_c0_g1_i1::g.16114::m.16114 TRINITY_DN976_c0_g1::TRINITY_DN976_c0_g1_i1::g.16114  ORF type:complete len:641 (+),score=135.25,sp/B0S6J3/SRGP2_DANRE/33.15/4e-26,RhoGAP/PF00620.22/8.9e+03,RhoGAP/PF00620.22/5.1e-35,HTH_29/PF13551.1/1.6e+02,HTH_29/PF13551.1/35,HTH_29/PF13551.1/2.9e+02,DUF1910/PF08928.5/2.4e+02,DUF1910/PF08928.5/3.3e+02,DUF1910/PF08928.5/28,Exonuc_VII_L/PF02601.10/8.2 TRINITY_DN976_c0_g1_i1:88-1923(+)
MGETLTEAFSEENMGMARRKVTQKLRELKGDTIDETTIPGLAEFNFQKDRFQTMRGEIDSLQKSVKNVVETTRPYVAAQDKMSEVLSRYQSYSDGAVGGSLRKLMDDFVIMNQRLTHQFEDCTASQLTVHLQGLSELNNTVAEGREWKTQVHLRCEDKLSADGNYQQCEAALAALAEGTSPAAAAAAAPVPTGGNRSTVTKTVSVTDKQEDAIQKMRQAQLGREKADQQLAESLESALQSFALLDVRLDARMLWMLVEYSRLQKRYFEEGLRALQNFETKIQEVQKQLETQVEAEMTKKGTTTEGSIFYRTCAFVDKDLDRATLRDASLLPPAIGGLGSTIKRSAISKKMTFGVPLEKAYCADLPVPLVLQRGIDYVTEHGLHDVGIFRLSGAESEVSELKAAYNNGEDIDLAGHDVNAVAAVLKHFFRDMPSKLFDLQVYDACLKLAEEGFDIATARDILATLPPLNYVVLEKFIGLMKKITQYSEENKMTEANLAIVIAPNLFDEPEEARTMTGMARHSKSTNEFCRLLIVHYEQLFSNPPPQIAEALAIREEKIKQGFTSWMSDQIIMLAETNSNDDLTSFGDPLGATSTKSSLEIPRKNSLVSPSDE